MLQNTPGVHRLLGSVRRTLLLNLFFDPGVMALQDDFYVQIFSSSNALIL
ncbi:MAG: hypothetical protein L7T26_04535 [Pseudomonadales bacterium]|nr:hypothetical protein [Pseudomonadales bacterium]